jgi:hypothetical protein
VLKGDTPLFKIAQNMCAEKKRNVPFYYELQW